MYKASCTASIFNFCIDEFFICHFWPYLLDAKSFLISPNSQLARNWTLWGVEPATCLGLLVTSRFREDNPYLYRSFEIKRLIYVINKEETDLKIMFILISIKNILIDDKGGMFNCVYWNIYFHKNNIFMKIHLYLRSNFNFEIFFQFKYFKTNIIWLLDLS